MLSKFEKLAKSKDENIQNVYKKISELTKLFEYSKAKVFANNKKLIEPVKVFTIAAEVTKDTVWSQ